MTISFARVVFTGSLLAALAIVGSPLDSHGQTNPDQELNATIRTAIESDPRTAEMSEADKSALVQLLAEQAASSGMTTADITWRPAENQVEEIPPSPCGPINDFLCSLSEAFGFSGNDLVIPIGLGVSAAFLLFVLGMMLLHHHGHHPLAGAIGTPKDTAQLQ